MTTWTPPRYPAGHADAGRIIVDPEQDVLATMDLMAEPPDPDAERAAAAAPAAPLAPVTPPAGSRTLADLLPKREAAAPAADDEAPLDRRVVGAVLAVAAVALAVYLSTRAPAGPLPSAAPPTAAPTAQATPAATSAPTSTALPPDVAPRAIVGRFDFQDPATAVAIERGERYALLGRAGTRWLFVETAAGARVWALAEDLGATVDPALPDLTPPPPAPVAPVRPAAPAAASVPVVCAEANAGFRSTVMVPPGAEVGQSGGSFSAWSCTSQADADAKALAAAQAANSWWTP